MLAAALKSAARSPCQAARTGLAAACGSSAAGSGSRDPDFGPNTGSGCARFDDPKHRDRLLTLPHELMRRASCRGRHPRRAALDAQLAVAIEILLMAPIRISNLCGLRLGRHVIVSGDLRDEAMTIVLSEDETKNNEPLEYPLPPRERPIAAPLCRSLPADPGGSRQRLPVRRPKWRRQAPRSPWPPRSSTGSSRPPGCTVNPHLMRHLGAKLYLESHPGAYEVARRVLGHRSIDTTTTFYTGLETAAAARHFDHSLIRRRREAEAALGLAKVGRRP